MMSSLYELTQDFKKAEIELREMDMDDQTIADTIEGMTGTIKEKSINVAKFIGNIDAEAAAIDGAIKSMQARKKALESKKYSLINYLKTSMESCNIDRISCEYFELEIVNNPESVVIDDIVPDEFMVEKTTKTPDKKAIKAHLKETGEKWAHIEKGTRLRIK